MFTEMEGTQPAMLRLQFWSHFVEIKEYPYRFLVPLSYSDFLPFPRQICIACEDVRCDFSSFLRCSPLSCDTLSMAIPSGLSARSPLFSSSSHLPVARYRPQDSQKRSRPGHSTCRSVGGCPTKRHQGACDWLREGKDEKNTKRATREKKRKWTKKKGIEGKKVRVTAQDWPDRPRNTHQTAPKIHQNTQSTEHRTQSALRSPLVAPARV